jgi:imidazolonepropionase-like amidohydrolase
MFPIPPTFLVCTIFSVLAAGSASRTADGEILEQGTFRLHLFKRPTGRETYEIRRAGDGVVLTASFENADRGVKEPLEASLRLSGHGSPVSLSVKGKTARFSDIDVAVAIEGKSATVRDGAKTPVNLPVPERYFCVGGFAPVSVQMMLVRDWARDRLKTPLPTFPGGAVRVEPRGRDAFEVGGKRIELDRYSVGGVIWGRETLWLDADRKLVAAITMDGELNRFEAVREGYEELLPVFISRAGEDGMAVLSELAERLGPRQAGPLAIVGARLVDGRSDVAVEDSVVVVEGDRITAAGPRTATAVPAGAKVVDGRGHTLLPGLWDMHAHVTQVEWGPLYLAAGVTTARDCANEFEFITSMRDALDAGRGLGPRLILAGIIDGEGPNTVGVDTATTAEQASALIRRYADARFAQIKIYDLIDHKLVPHIARETHHRGLTLTGHLPTGMDLDRAIEAGMDQVNHLYNVAFGMRTGPPVTLPEKHTFNDYQRRVLDVDLDSDHARKIVSLLKERGTVVDPTLALMELLNHSTDRALETFEPGAVRVAAELAIPLAGFGVPPADGKEAGAFMQKYRDVLAALIKAGVTIVAGTDGCVPGHSLHRELELYVEAGMTPTEAIRSATVVPARVMKLDREVGTIEPGKCADLILVEGRPDLKISDIRRTKTVITAGRMFDCGELWKSVGFRP